MATDVASLQRLIAAAYGSAQVSPEDRQAATQQLLDFQWSPVAVAVCLQLLREASTSLQMSIFAAQTLYMKCAKSWGHVLRTPGSPVGVRDAVLQLLCSPCAGDARVARQLARVAAMLALRMCSSEVSGAEWPDPVHDLLREVLPQHPDAFRAVLYTLTELCEVMQTSVVREFSSESLSLKVACFRGRSSDVLRFLEQLFGLLRQQQPAQVLGETRSLLECLAEWLDFGLAPPAVACSPLLPLMFDAFQHPHLCEAAARALEHAARLSRRTGGGGLVQALLPRVAALPALVEHLIRADETDSCERVCAALSALLPPLLQCVASDHADAQREAVGVFAALMRLTYFVDTGGAEETVWRSRAVVYLWVDVARAIHRCDSAPVRELVTQRLSEVLVALLRQLTFAVQYPPHLDEDDELELDDFERFRYAVGDSVLDIVQALQLQRCLIVLRDRLLEEVAAVCSETGAGRQASWRGLEGVLFCFRCLRRLLCSQEERDVLPVVLELLLQRANELFSPTRDPRREVLHTTLSLMAGVSKWLTTRELPSSRSPGAAAANSVTPLLRPCLQLAIACLSDASLPPRVCDMAATALRNALHDGGASCLARDGGDAQLQDSVLALWPAALGRLSRHGRKDLTGAIVALVYARGVAEQHEALQYLLRPHLEVLRAVAAGSRSLEDPEVRARLWTVAEVFRRYSMLADHQTAPLRTAAQDRAEQENSIVPLVALLREHFDVLAHVMTHSTADEDVMEDVHRIFRYACSCAPLQFLPIVEPLLQAIVAAFQHGTDGALVCSCCPLFLPLFLPLPPSFEFMVTQLYLLAHMVQVYAAVPPDSALVPPALAPMFGLAFRTLFEQCRHRLPPLTSTDALDAVSDVLVLCRKILRHAPGVLVANPGCWLHVVEYAAACFAIADERVFVEARDLVVRMVALVEPGATQSCEGLAELVTAALRQYGAKICANVVFACVRGLPDRYVCCVRV
ncbi:MAG: hypothetical protein MHM6MM_004810, partial [Cercozoa sp. M6MM]